MTDTPALQLNTALAKRLIQVERNCFVTWVKQIAAVPGNPYGAGVQQFGQSTAVVCRAFKPQIFNRVFEMTLDAAEHIPDILEFFYRNGGTPLFDLNPYVIQPYFVRSDLPTILSRMGLFQAAFHQMLYGVPTTSVPPTPAHIDIQAVGDHEINDFCGIYDSVKGDAGLPVRLIYGHPEYRCYIAYIEGEPAGLGILHVANGAASMATGITVPEMRNRGCQTALLYRRIHDAAAAGCHLMVSQCQPGSSSQNNQLRVGFQIAGSKVWWVSDPSDTNQTA
jgi:hypothetical protein